MQLRINGRPTLDVRPGSAGSHGSNASGFTASISLIPVELVLDSSAVATISGSPAELLELAARIANAALFLSTPTPGCAACAVGEGAYGPNSTHDSGCRFAPLYGLAHWSLDTGADRRANLDAASLRELYERRLLEERAEVQKRQGIVVHASRDRKA